MLSNADERKFKVEMNFELSGQRKQCKTSYSWPGERFILKMIFCLSFLTDYCDAYRGAYQRPNVWTATVPSSIWRSIRRPIEGAHSERMIAACSLRLLITFAGLFEGAGRCEPSPFRWYVKRDQQKPSNLEKNKTMIERLSFNKRLLLVVSLLVGVNGTLFSLSLSLSLSLCLSLPL